MFRKYIKREEQDISKQRSRKYRTTDLILHNATQFRLRSVTYKTPGHILCVMGAGCCCFIDRQFTELLFLEGPSFVVVPAMRNPGIIIKRTIRRRCLEISVSLHFWKRSTEIFSFILIIS